MEKQNKKLLKTTKNVLVLFLLFSSFGIKASEAKQVRISKSEETKVKLEKEEQKKPFNKRLELQRVINLIHNGDFSYDEDNNKKKGLYLEPLKEVKFDSDTKFSLECIYSVAADLAGYYYSIKEQDLGKSASNISKKVYKWSE